MAQRPQLALLRMQLARPDWKTRYLRRRPPAESDTRLGFGLLLRLSFSPPADAFASVALIGETS